MDEPPPPNPEVPERSSGRRQFSAKYKAKVLAEYDTLPRSARGAMLRRERALLLVDHDVAPSSATRAPRRPWPTGGTPKGRSA